VLQADPVARLAVRRDGGGNRHDAVARKEMSDEADPLDVRVAIGLRVAKLRTQVPTEIVTVQHFDATSAVRQCRCEGPCECRFAGARKTGEPQREAMCSRRIGSVAQIVIRRDQLTGLFHGGVTFALWQTALCTAPSVQTQIERGRYLLDFLGFSSVPEQCRPLPNVTELDRRFTEMVDAERTRA
jgi:hypothetical protein